MKQRTIILSDEVQKKAAILLISNSAEKPMMEVVIRAHKPNKTLEQNGYYWAVVIPTIRSFIAEHMGEFFSPVALDHYLRGRYVESVTEPGPRGPITYVPSISQIKKEPLAKYIDLLINEYAQWGCFIPQPEK